jgi:hypothetical protein
LLVVYADDGRPRPVIISDELAMQVDRELGGVGGLAGKGGPDLLTVNERRLIKHVREYTTGTDAIPVINDASTVVALVML